MRRRLPLARAWRGNETSRRRWALVSLITGTAGLLHVLEAEWTRAAFLLGLSAAMIPLALGGTR